MATQNNDHQSIVNDKIDIDNKIENNNDKEKKEQKEYDYNICYYCNNECNPASQICGKCARQFSFGFVPFRF